MNDDSISSIIPALPAVEEPPSWSVDDAKTLYNLDKWGSPYFTVNQQGHVAVRPLYEGDTEIDIYGVIEEVKRRGIQLPVLIRFQDLLRRRVIELNESFRRAIDEFVVENSAIIGTGHRSQLEATVLNFERFYLLGPLRGQSELEIDGGKRGRELAQVSSWCADQAAQLAEAPMGRGDGRIRARQDQR